MGQFEDFAKDVSSKVANSVEASHRFVEDTLAHPDRRAKQVAAGIDGVIVGGIKAIPDRIVNHPQETLTTAAGGLIVGGAFGALAVMESPLIVAGVAIGGTALTCKYVYDLGTKFSKDTQLKKAFDDIWNGVDGVQLKKSLPVIENRFGKETFDLALLGATGGYAFKGGSALMKGAMRPPSQLAFAEATACGGKQKPLNTGSEIKDQTSCAMEGYRDRMGHIRYDRRSPEYFATLMEQPLAKRLDYLEELIRSGRKGEAYDFVNASLGWYQDRSAPYDSVLGKISRDLLYVGTNMWSVVHEGPATASNNKALKLIQEMREKYCNSNSDWPLKVCAEDAHSPDRIRSLTDKQRVIEIEKLYDAGYTDDALKIANWCYVIHRDAKSPQLEKKYDQVLFELGKIYFRAYNASEEVCQQRLIELKKAVGL